MQPLKLNIEGNFWDCQIYSGKLYLWTLDGELLIYNWEEIIESLIKKEEDRLALNCGFSRGDYLYGDIYSVFFQDKEVADLIQKKFERVQKINYNYSLENLKHFLHLQINNPFKDLPIDTEIYLNNLYSITDNGLFSTNVYGELIETPSKHWDCHLLSLKAKSNRIALSGGDEGLFNYNIESTKFTANRTIKKSIKKVDKNIFQVSKKHSLYSNWIYTSIYSTSNIEKSFAAAFKLLNYDDPENRKLMYNGIYSENDIFQEQTNHHLSWGVDDKIYKIYDRSLAVVNFKQGRVGSVNNLNPFSEVKRIEFQSWKGEVIKGGVAYFGTIVELENALVVLLSDGNIYNIPGPITRWRVYPRSKRYENHLHVIFDDSICIYSFNNDYFINQKDKNMGITYRKNIFYKR